MPHLFDELESIDRYCNKNSDPSAVVLHIEVEDIYKQIEKGRAIRPNSVRWIHEIYNSIKDVI